MEEVFTIIDHILSIVLGTLFIVATMVVIRYFKRENERADVEFMAFTLKRLIDGEKELWDATAERAERIEKEKEAQSAPKTKAKKNVKK